MPAIVGARSHVMLSGRSALRSKPSAAVTVRLSSATFVREGGPARPYRRLYALTPAPEALPRRPARRAKRPCDSCLLAAPGERLELSTCGLTGGFKPSTLCALMR